MKINQLKTGAILTYVSMGLGFLISLIYTPIMIRLLGQSEYGLYNLAASVIAYLGILNFGFGSAYIRFYSRYRVKNDENGIAKLNGIFLIIFTVIGIAVIFMAILISFNARFVFGTQITDDEVNIARLLVIILGVNLAISFPNLIFNAFIRANERFVFDKLLTISRILMNPFIVLPVLLLGFGSIGMAISVLSISLLFEIINIVYSRRILRIAFIFNSFEFDIFKEVFIFSFYIFLNLIIEQLLWNIDRFILGRSIGVISVAVYSLVLIFVDQYKHLSVAISSVFVPRLNFIINKDAYGGELIDLMVKIGRLQFIILSLFYSGFVLFGNLFLELWVGPDFYESYYILLIILPFVTVPIIQNIGIEIQRALNLHKFRTISYIFIAILNLFLTIFLVNLIGIYGAAISTALAILIGHIIMMNLYYHLKIRLDMKKFWLNIASILPAFIPPVIFGGLIAYFRSSLPMIISNSDFVYLVFASVSYGLVFLFSVYGFAMSPTEKSLIRAPLKIFTKLIWKDGN